METDEQPLAIRAGTGLLEGVLGLPPQAVGIVVFALIYAWLVIHRFRLEYLREQLAETGLSHAIEQRRAEAEPVLPATAGGAR